MPGYPGIATDYLETFAALRNLPVDIFIGAHASYYDGMEKARKAYQDFFALWKDADADIPILKEAKAEYAKLP